MRSLRRPRFRAGKAFGLGSQTGIAAYGSCREVERGLVAKSIQIAVHGKVAVVVAITFVTVVLVVFVTTACTHKVSTSERTGVADDSCRRRLWLKGSPELSSIRIVRPCLSGERCPCRWCLAGSLELGSVK